jgi:hypothetical protein
VGAVALTLGLIVRSVHERLYRIPESQVRLTTGVAWGMIGFALLHALFSASVIYAAWCATRLPSPKQARRPGDEG